MNNIEVFTTPSSSFQLRRLPYIPNNSLRAWDAADELLINTVFNEKLSSEPLLIINDSFGALTLAFHKKSPDSWSDSLISHLATNENYKQNNIVKTDSTHFIPATDDPQGSYKLVIIKIPKTLALLEDQLHRLKPHIDKDTRIIGAAMTKHIHNSTLSLFETIIGTTTTSRATKKARLIFAKNNVDKTSKSPYPITISDEKTQLNLINHANVFSKDKLDVGSRFFIQHIEHCPKAEHIIDIGCGNGALGIIAKRHQPNAKIRRRIQNLPTMQTSMQAML